MNFKFLSLAVILVFSSCSQVKQDPQRSYDLLNIVYFTKAAETKALQLQAYNVAKDNLSKIIKQRSNKPFAVILDIDETVLDNSPYQITTNISDTLFPEGWIDWTTSARAELIAGAKDFIDYAQKNKVRVLLITNRGELEKVATLKNLEDKKIKVDVNDVFFKQDTSSKETRRAEISKVYNVALLIGDNLADFDALYDKKSVDERDATTAKLSAEFGRKYILLPNSMYGDWEGAIYDGKYPKTSAEKDQVLKDYIKKISKP